VGSGRARLLLRSGYVAEWAGGRILLAGEVPVNDNPRSLSVVRPDGTGLHRIVRVPAGSALSSFAFAWGGSTVVFRSEITSPGSLFTVDASTGRIRRLTHDGRGASTPAWSPDGRSIAFGRTDVVGRCHGCDWDLAVLRTATGAAIRVRGSQAFHPSWAPAGDRLAYGDISEEGFPIIYTVRGRRLRP
jgi:Tol biopolymer transport system component